MAKRIVTKTQDKIKKISLGIAHIKTSFNNTIVTFTDTQGNAIANSSAGKNGFKGTKKPTPHAARVTVESASNKAKERTGGLLKTISVRIQGPGVQRESALRALCEQGFVITSMSDVSPIPHNGCKPPKRRRV